MRIKFDWQKIPRLVLLYSNWQLSTGWGNKIMAYKLCRFYALLNSHIFAKSLSAIEVSNENKIELTEST